MTGFSEKVVRLSETNEIYLLTHIEKNLGQSVVQL